MAYASSGLQPGEIMNHKVPPAFDGRGSWFAYEELVMDWEDSCSLSEEHRGPAMKNRLYGEAIIFKPLLDREKLKDKLRESSISLILCDLNS
jgi:hypothetical protein